MCREEWYWAFKKKFFVGIMGYRKCYPMEIDIFFSSSIQILTHFQAYFHPDISELQSSGVQFLLNQSKNHLLFRVVVLR
jgi:hypothetical protein